MVHFGKNAANTKPPNAPKPPITTKSANTTFPFSTTTLIILSFLFINLFCKKIFSNFISPNQTRRNI